MSSYNLRNSQLLQQVKAHPLKATLAKALDISENFQGDVQFLELDKNLSPEGRQNAMQSKLRGAIRDLRDARAPVDEMQKKLDQKRKTVTMPKFDPADVVGFLRRQELRAILREKAKEGHLRGMLALDPAFADALLEQPFAVSGATPDLVEEVKKERLAGLYAPQLAEIDELEKTIAEANMIADIARVDLQSSAGMEPAQFNEFCKPIEARQNAPWLRRDKDFDGNERIYVVDLENHRGRIATEDERRDGVFFKDFAEYQASRAA